jgi:hypothetical protein
MRRIIATSIAIALALTAAMTHAQQKKKYGTWNLNITSEPDEPMQMASTVNSTGSSTGVLCVQSTESCDTFIKLDITCKHGAFYPMMINSAVGAFHLSTKCVHLGDLQLFVAEDAAPMMSAFESGGEIGFAMPLESGQFRVVRFSTAGATPAIKAARQLQPANRPRTKTNRRSDEIL